jgi:type IV pilus assembly protein PilX
MMLRSAQRGMILMMALIALVAMTLAAVALVRSVDTGLLVASNLAFRQAATMAADTGLRNATTWLLSNTGGTTLHNNQFSNADAYWANAQNVVPAFDPLNYDWEGGNNSLLVTADDGNGNNIRYVIHRLCDAPGNPIGVACVRPPATSGSANNSSKGVVSAGSLPMTATANAYYRVTVRVRGPRNTTSYVQAVIY